MSHCFFLSKVIIKSEPKLRLIEILIVTLIDIRRIDYRSEGQLEQDWEDYGDNIGRIDSWSNNIVWEVDRHWNMMDVHNKVLEGFVAITTLCTMVFLQASIICGFGST
uniref:Uncharacterized protein n=1 Tax=Physcomitrium patens TaxID=3218 RepID=A0A2K1JQR5_PHYPA|nr:hypothetical protein PHYPA_016255 [Physcomitrium patens]